MPYANEAKVESYRDNVKRLTPWMSCAAIVSALGYAGALWFGMSSAGWLLFVVAVACSFWYILLGIHTQEQEQTADLLQCMIELSKQGVDSATRSEA